MMLFSLHISLTMAVNTKTLYTDTSGNKIKDQSAILMNVDSGKKLFA